MYRHTIDLNKFDQALKKVEPLFKVGGKMTRTFNKTGSHCYQSGIICDHNMVDSPDKLFICLGYCGKCSNGSAWEYFVKKENRLYLKGEAKFIDQPPIQGGRE